MLCSCRVLTETLRRCALAFASPPGPLLEHPPPGETDTVASLLQIGMKGIEMILQVIGANLVPFTLQKQNAVAAAVADLLPSVFSVRLILVDQASPEAGQSISSAEVSLVVQQDASAIPVELARPSYLTAFVRSCTWCSVLL